MKEKILLMLLTGLIILVVSLPSITASYAIKTTTSDTTCNDGICTLTLYSYPKNIYEDGKWKDWTEAGSLKGYYVVKYLEKDKDFAIEVLDYNYTDILFKLNFIGDASKYSEFCTDRTASEKDCSFKLTVNDTLKDTLMTANYNMKSIDGKNQNTDEIVDISYPFGKTIKFGGHSTEIILQTADTENLADTYVNEYYLTTSYGSATTMRVGWDSYWHNKTAYIAFGLPLPSGAVISNANLTMQIIGGEAGAIYHAIYQVYDYPWSNSSGGSNVTEMSMNWNNQPCGTAFDNSTYCNLTADDVITPVFGSNSYNITNTIIRSLGKSNVSFVIRQTAGDSTGWQYATKENVFYSTPVLTISFTMVDPGVSNVTIAPSPFYTDSALNCSAKYLSSVAGGMVEFRWWKNGHLNESYNCTIEGLGEGMAAYANVSISERLVIGDSWMCQARAYNGTEYSSFLNSTSLQANARVTYFSPVNSTPLEYNIDLQSHFNITWNVSGGEIDTVLFHGSWATPNITISNDTYGGDIYNYSALLGAGSYTWYSCANDTIIGSFNCTSSIAFVIAKNSSNPIHTNLTFSGTQYTDSSLSVITTDTVTVACYLDYASSGTAALFIDNVSYSNPTTATFGAGTYEILCNSSGNDNYTSNSTAWSVTLTSSALGGGGGGGGGTDTIIIQNVTAELTGPTIEDWLETPGYAFEAFLLTPVAGPMPLLVIVMFLATFIYITNSVSKRNGKMTGQELVVIVIVIAAAAMLVMQSTQRGETFIIDGSNIYTAIVNWIQGALGNTAAAVYSMPEWGKEVMDLTVFGYYG